MMVANEHPPMASGVVGPITGPVTGPVTEPVFPYRGDTELKVWILSRIHEVSMRKPISISEWDTIQGKLSALKEVYNRLVPDEDKL